MQGVILHPNVEIGHGSVVEPFVILGHPPGDQAPGALRLAIGASARIRSHTVVYAGSSIGARFSTGHGVLVRQNAEIGDDCSVGSGAVVEFNVVMGRGVRLHSNVFVPEFSILGDGAWLGPNVVLTNAKFPQSTRAKATLTPVRIGPAAKIGANATLLPGVQIGAGALVGAGSVVTRDVAPGDVVVGNPARVIAKVWELLHDDTGLPAYPKEPA